MPGVSKTQRTEAKYNVTIEFPHLGLHSAAATGNIGLVKYALDNGQPVNSVLDGVLPLHAACSGGNDLVVRLLIEKGADVNAPRLPRRYSSDKNRDASAPIVGASGSTPLHFACANGHTDVVLTLLMHGAHPDRPDKHGTTPEMLARQNGWIACADVLKQWSYNKDKDLRERERSNSFANADLSSGVATTTEDRHQYCGSSDCRICIVSKRLRVKRSIDNALNMFIPALSQSSPSFAVLDSTGQPGDSAITSSVSPSGSMGDYTFNSTGPGDAGMLPARRPSLPHVLETPQTMPHIKSPHPSGSRSRRPRSAGTDADQSPTLNKVRGKISLMNIFKKSISDTSSASEGLSGYTTSNSAVTSASPSPAPDHRAGLSTLPLSSRTGSPHGLASPSPDNSAPTRDTHNHFRGRLFSESESVNHVRAPLAVDLHRALSSERLSSKFAKHEGFVTDLGVSRTRSPSTRPSILRLHHRSSSGQLQTDGQKPGPSAHSSSRALRFDSTSTTAPSHSLRNDARRHASRSPARNLNSSRSVTSIRSELMSDSPRMPLEMALELDEDESGLGSATRITAEPEGGCDLEEEDEDQYGELIVSRLAGMNTEGLSQIQPTLSSQSSLSPLSPLNSRQSLSTRFDCPFNINSPPDDSSQSENLNSLGTHGMDNRVRGDSVSSTSTDASGQPPSSGGTSGFVTTPAVSHPQLPGPMISSSPSIHTESPSINIRHVISDQDGMESQHFLDDLETPLASKSPRAPLDINIHSISSHAQAEALVQLAQQSILDMQEIEIESKPSGGDKVDRTPLSAKLAAYGESLAIERKFKQEREDRRRSPSAARSPRQGFHVPEYREEAVSSHGSRGLDRKFSLEERPHHTRTVKHGRVRRPHTSGGTPSSNAFLSGSPHRGSSPSHRQRSTTASRADSKSTSIESDHLSHSLSASLTPPKSMHLKVNSEVLPGPPPKLHRSRTPDPEPHTSRRNAHYHAEGIPLSRISTAPAQDSCVECVPGRPMNEQERQIARANKLAKMGFHTTDSWQKTSIAPRSHISIKPRFEGIKSFVQTFKGKS
ncbi:hypothetical protein AcW1_009205 [Taiwanofungus camphoratus]|nr:hypothetical protein AcW1_009205 [Antrodia cinnamomea]KAI0958520.1 hypothetical protein AcV7_004321 [Antrodia cinnamomea]